MVDFKKLLIHKVMILKMILKILLKAIEQI
jgi:hypothetical protein